MSARDEARRWNMRLGLFVDTVNSIALGLLGAAFIEPIFTQPEAQHQIVGLSWGALCAAVAIHGIAQAMLLMSLPEDE